MFLRYPGYVGSPTSNRSQFDNDFSDTFAMLGGLT